LPSGSPPAPDRTRSARSPRTSAAQQAGAVGNALTTLADRAEAARITGKPLRYEANSAAAAAAAAITPKAPAPPRAAPAAPPPAASPAAPPASSAAPKPAGPSAPKAPAPAAKPGPVTRPGGQVYRPRVLAGMGDVEALRTEGIPSLLAGPPGTEINAERKRKGDGHGKVAAPKSESLNSARPSTAARGAVASCHAR
jgi:hypothetical protein